MVEFSSSLKLNEIRIVESLFNEDSKNINFFPGRPRGTVGKLTITGISIVIQIGGMVNFERDYQYLPLGTKILVMPRFPTCQTKF